jgi:peptide/nickel transport system substrate-binding protein
MDQREQGVTMTAVHVQTGLNNRFTRLRRCLLSALLALPLPAIAAAPQTCGTVIVPPGVGSGAPPASVTELNPFFASSTYNQVAGGLLYEGLIWVNRDHTITWARSLVTKIDVSKNNTVFTVTMKPWMWSDGKPVTASDVLYTFNTIKKLGPTFLNYGTGGIPTVVKSFTVINPQQFRIVTLHPVNPTWFEIEGLPVLAPYPEHIWGKYTINQMWRRQSDPSFFHVVDGPYRVASFKLGRHIIFEPNSTYQGHKSQISRFIMKFLHSSGAEIEGIRSGSIDISNLPFSLWQEGHRLKNVRLIKIQPAFGFDYTQLNYKNPAVAFFRDVKVRQAMVDAISQRIGNKLLLHGLGTVQHGPVPVDPATFLSPSARLGQWPVGYNPTKAKQLLDEAGWKPGPDGIRVKNGKRLAFTYLQASGGSTSMLGAELTQQWLRAVGIDMKIRLVTFNQLLALSQKPLAWEAMGFGWQLGSYPSDGAQLRTNGAQNQAGYSDPKMDRLLNAVTTEAGTEALYQYQDYAAEQQPELFAGNPGSVILVRKGLRGISKFISPTGSWSPQYLHFTAPPCGSAIAANVTP